jgi:hypothetical protein
MSMPKRHVYQFFTYLLITLTPAVYSTALAQNVSPELLKKIESVTDQLVEMLPVGHIFDDSASKDAFWPLLDKAKNVSAADLKCMRDFFSKANYRNQKLLEVTAYALEHPARFESDVKLLSSGFSKLLSKIMFAGIVEKSSGVKIPNSEIINDATADELADLWSFLFEPKYQALKDLSGLGLLTPGNMQPGAGQKAGIDIGTAIIGKQTILASLVSQR